MRVEPRLLAGAMLALWAVAPAGTRQRSAAEPALTIDGEVNRSFTLAELRALPRVTVTASEHGAPPATYEGVGLGTIMETAGVPLGAALRGPRMATYVIVTAADQYRALFALPELNSAITGRTIVLADRKAGADLDAREGPLRIVAPDERRPARWVRQVVRLTVRQLRD
ncbi:MAG: molybdopterin-dependent oxidoreductase [Gemmatimonadota bacterium]